MKNEVDGANRRAKIACRGSGVLIPVSLEDQCKALKRIKQKESDATRGDWDPLTGCGRVVVSRVCGVKACRCGNAYKCKNALVGVNVSKKHIKSNSSFFLRNSAELVYTLRLFAVGSRPRVTCSALQPPCKRRPPRFVLA